MSARKIDATIRKDHGGRWLQSFKALVLAFVAFQTLFLDLLPIYERPHHFRIIGTGIYFVGLATAVIGRLQLGKNWLDLEDYQLLAGQSLVTHGIYRYIRHPIYTGDILLLVGLELALNSWLVLASCSVLDHHPASSGGRSSALSGVPGL